MRTFIFIFFLIICLPILQMVFHIVPEYKNTEKRQLAQFSISPRFLDYFNDNLGFRTWLIHWNNYLKVKALGVSPLPFVTVGKDGWLFYTSEATNDGTSTNDYRGLAPLPKEKVHAIKTNLEDLSSYFSDQGILFIVLVAPNKQTIYGNFLPANLSDQGTSRFDQVKTSLANSPVNLLDLRDILKAPPRSYPTYFKTDSHWNTYGSFLAAQVLLSTINSTHPEVAKLDSHDFTFGPTTSPDPGDIATMLALEGYFATPDVLVTPKVVRPYHLDPKTVSYSPGFLGFKTTSPARLNPKLVFFGDSFGTKLIPFLAPHFREAQFLGGGLYRVDKPLVAKLKSDVVVWEVAERFVDRLSNP